MATVTIKDLCLRCVIGLNDWERKDKQDVVINIEFDFDAERAVAADDGELTVDYKTITKRVIAGVEGSSFKLLESLADLVLRLVMESEGVLRATVEVDKPHSLRFAESVSVTFSAER
ncbi:MAG: FolB domain-containing protein [Candidatus Glassbacteria bacterium]|nr:FolB domain-containing protein [Candidatus Glassbacteria bacterium]